MSIAKYLLIFLLVSPAVQAVDLIGGIDQTISVCEENPEKSQPDRFGNEILLCKDEPLLAQRYLRLRARLSVYSLYCNPALAVQFRQMGERNKALERRVELTVDAFPMEFGEEPVKDFQRAYNMFENFRNEESSRYSFIDRPVECQNNRARYDYFIRMSSHELESLLRQTPYGLM